MPYNVIEAFDQPWKREQEGTVGGYWGIFDDQARPKFSMQGPVVEEPRWHLGLAAGAAGLVLFLLAAPWRRHWQGAKGWLALALAGFASGTAMAWQFRQIWFAARNSLDWAFSLSMCVLAFATAIGLARWVATRLAGEMPTTAPKRRLRFAWMFGLTFYGLLLVFDGRYRDFPLGLFWPPALGYLLAALLEAGRNAIVPTVEERFLSCALPLLAAGVVAQEVGLNPATWLWLGLNLAFAAAVWIEWRRSSRLQAHQA
jgi:glucan 1,3-beta-glucosidase